MAKIINDVNEVLGIRKQTEENGQRLGLVSGSFDILTIGHTRYLNKAKNVCDILIVAIDSDEKVKKRKGENRPIVPQDERIEMMSNISCVDYCIVKQDTWEKWKLIKMLNPILILTEDTYDQKTIEKLKKICKEVHVFTRQAKTSTSEKIRKSQLTGGQEIKDAVSEAIDKILIKWGLQKRINEI